MTMEYKKGFNIKKFEDDYFVFRRGSTQKHFHNWDEVQYEGGISPMFVNRRELEDGNMSQPLYDFLAHVYGEEAMSQYFPAPEPERKRQPVLHFGVGSIMANGVGRQPYNPAERMNHLSGKGGMSDEELEELAILLCGSTADVNAMKKRKGFI